MVSHRKFKFGSPLSASEIQHIISPKKLTMSFIRLSHLLQTLQEISFMCYFSSPRNSNSSFYIKFCVLTEVFLVVWKGGGCFSLFNFATTTLWLPFFKLRTSIFMYLFVHFNPLARVAFLFAILYLKFILWNLWDDGQCLIIYGMPTRGLHSVILLIINVS